MRKLWEIINIPRSIPALLMYRHLSCQNEIREDLLRNGGNGSWWNLHRELLRSTVARKIFYYRTNQHAPVLTKLSKILYRPFESMEIDADSIGGGMQVFHGYSTIVFARSIGKNFTVYQQVTIGRGKKLTEMISRLSETMSRFMQVPSLLEALRLARMLQLAQVLW